MPNCNFKEPVSSPVMQNAVSLSLWPLLTASLTFPYPLILNLPCAFSPPFLHTFTFSSLNQSAGQDAVPLEPWSIAIAHEERMNVEEWRKRRKRAWTYFRVLLCTYWHGLRDFRDFKMLKTRSICTAQNHGCVDKFLIYLCLSKSSQSLGCPGSGITVIF